MSGVPNINNTLIPAGQVQAPRNSAPVEKEAKNNFADTIRGFIEKVDADQKKAGQEVENIISGQSENLAEAMTALEESRLSFQLLLEIRNRLLESYQEISKMQI
jgi:flagellar hook-basal body complex protein FliE